MDKRHTDREFESELALLRQRLVNMAGRVEEMIRRSVLALVNRDETMAHETILSDHRVNQDEMEADEQCLVILARRQPMASDLRFLTLSLKMVTDLERIGDLAVNVCERVLDLQPYPPIKPYEDISRMAGLVEVMLHSAIEAFVTADADKARKVIKSDDDVDELYHRIFCDLMDLIAANGAVAKPIIHIQSIAKYLERMADHCTNLAEQVVFLTQGEDIRHEGHLDQR